MKNIIEAQKEFEKCWQNPAYTQIELHDVDVNQALLHYTTNKPVRFTREILWDMEKKKAWNPGKYIAYVVREGSARSWGKESCSAPEGELFVRTSEQKKWLNPDVYEKVYEEVYVNNEEQLITFLGVKTLPGCSEELTPKQPLFHVQHAVSGEEDNPLNKWRIVFLTEEKNERLLKHFENFNNPHILPGFIEIYIEKDLGVMIELHE